MNVWNILMCGAGVALGALAVQKQIPEESVKALEKNLLSRWTIAKHFRFSRMIHRILSGAVQSGTLGGSLKFGLGIIFLFLYFFLINLLVNLGKVILYAIWQVCSPNYLLAFSLLLGAGIMAYGTWVQKLRDEASLLKRAWRQDQTGVFVKGALARGVKLLALTLTYALWVMGEVVLLFFSPGYLDWARPFYTFATIFFLGMAGYLLATTLWPDAGKTK